MKQDLVVFEGGLDARVKAHFDIRAHGATYAIENDDDVVNFIEDDGTLPLFEFLAGISAGGVHADGGERGLGLVVRDLAADAGLPGLVFEFGADLFLAVDHDDVVAGGAGLEIIPT